MKKLGLIGAIIVSSLLIIILVLWFVYKNSISAVGTDATVKEFKVEYGDNYYSIADRLYETHMIKSKLGYKIYLKLNPPKNPLAMGIYYLSENMTVKDIIEVLSDGGFNPNTIKITFQEGKNMRYIASTIAANTNNKEEDVYALLNDTDYLESLIEKYWFIDESILNDEIYYPLEGYLFPDTYQFTDKDVSVEQIFEILLDEMEYKLSEYKEAILKSKYTFHELLTLASIIEVEAKSISDRKMVAGVFYNRLNIAMSLGSDVTTYYGAKKDFGESIVVNLDDCNGYNTRGTCVSGLPVGPISSVSITSIEAVLYPESTDYYYFVADCDGKTHFSKTNSENLAMKSQLIKEGNWCEN